MYNIDQREIRKELAELYNNMEDAQIVAKDIDLQLARITISLKIEVYWSNIWDEAKKQHKELKLINRALLDYPDNKKLIRIHDQIIHKQAYPHFWPLREVSSRLQEALALRIPPEHQSQPQTSGGQAIQQLALNPPDQLPEPLGENGAKKPSPNTTADLAIVTPPSQHSQLIIRLPSIKTLISIILYSAAVLLLLLDILPLFNILGPMVFLKKLMWHNPANLP